MTTCPSVTGPGPCANPVTHHAPHGCVRESSSGSFVDDRHADRGHG